MSKPSGKYSIIQYSAAPERFEFVNIGILLLDLNRRHVGFRFAQSAKRLDLMFGKQPRAFLSALKDGLYNRVHAELGPEWDVQRLEKFAASRANNVRLSKLQPILIENPEVDLADLFSSLVFDEQPAPRVPRLASELRREFVRAGVEQFVERPRPIELPQGVKIDVPYAYQNGAYNLIDPVRLAGAADGALAQASKRAVQGQWLWQYSMRSARPSKLVVVGEVTQQEPSFIIAVREMMQQHNVKFYEMSHVDPLLDDIKQNAPKNVTGASILTL